MTLTKTNSTRRRQHWPILGVIALAFGLRLQSLTLFSYHIDEFFTLAAAKLIAASGAPRYPTGLFYDPGLPFSYLDGALFRWFGFSEALGRWPAVLFGALAVATLYVVGTRLLRSPEIGLLAAFWLALDVDSVEWGGRARMITLAQWLALLSVALLWIGLTRPSVRHRLLFALSYGLTLLTHFSTIVLLPAWGVAAAGLWGAKIISLSRRLIRDGLFLLLVSGLALASGVIFQPPPSVAFQQADQGLDTKVGILSNKFLQLPSDLGHAWEIYAPYFITLPHGPILALSLLGLVISLIRVAKERGERGGQTKGRHPESYRARGAFFLGLILITALAVLAGVIHPHWQRSRYFLMQGLGLFYLLGAYGLREILIWLPLPALRKPAWQTTLAVISALILSAPFYAPLQESLDAGYIGWNRYDLAFKHAAENLQDGDKVMTMHPPANLIYLGQYDYYLVQSSPKLIIRPDGGLGDRYTGALWLQSESEFNEVISAPERLWLISQEYWLFNSYDSYLQQQILQRMDKLWGEGGVWALVSRPGAWPLAKDIAVPFQGEFENGVRLAGFTTQPDIVLSSPAPGSVIWLTLFWQGEQLPNDYKVFVHVRDEDNNTVAQADHIIYDGKVPNSRWGNLFENDTSVPGGAIRDGATLVLPPDLPPGTYRLLVGFYHPETFARVGVIQDQSGEAALILHTFVIE